MKKVGKYITISLLLLLGLCCVGILYLFFVPNSDLFNITYVNNNKIIESNKFDANYVNLVELNSRAYDVRILTSENNTIYVKTYSNSFGFVNKKNKDVFISSKTNFDILTFNVKETYGLTSHNSSYIELYLPENIDINLSLKNEKATTVISNVTIDNLKYTTQKGDLNFKSGQIKGSLDLNLGKSDFTINKDVSTAKNDVHLKLSTGSFKAINSDLGDVTINSNNRGVISLKSCENLRQISKSAGGQINAKTVMHATITSGDTNITIDKITNSATIDLLKSGKVNIKDLIGLSSLKTNSGNINLENTYSIVTAETSSGKINIKNAFSTVTVKVAYGEANISFSEEAESYLDNNNSRVLYASVKNGKLTANGVEYIGIPEEIETGTINGGIKVTGNGRIFLNMNNIYGNNSIVGNNGSVNVVINKTSSYILKTSSSSGNVRVNLTQIPEYNGYTTKQDRTTYVNCTESSHSLKVTSIDGDLKIFDTNFA